MLILLLLRAGGEVPNTQVALRWNIRLRSLKYCTVRLGHNLREFITCLSCVVEGQQHAGHMSSVLEDQPRVLGVNVYQLHDDSVCGMTTDRLLKRPLSGPLLSSRGTSGCAAPHLN